MTFARSDTFRSIGQIVAAEMLPAPWQAQKLPLRVYCLGLAGYDAEEHAESFEHMIALGEAQSPDEAMRLAGRCLSRGGICSGSESFPHFGPHLMLIQDREFGLVLAGEIRAALIFWQPPVASDAEARQIVINASRLRGMAYRAADSAEVRILRDRAAVLEARLVDPAWREIAAELLRLPKAA